MDSITQVQVITIEEQKRQKRFIRKDENGMEIGLLGREGRLDGAISCGKFVQDTWQTLELSSYPGLEIASVPDREGSIISHYIAIPATRPPEGYLAFTQQITSTVILFIPLVSPILGGLDEWKTYYVRGSIEIQK